MVHMPACTQLVAMLLTKSIVHQGALSIGEQAKGYRYFIICDHQEQLNAKAKYNSTVEVMLACGLHCSKLHCWVICVWAIP